MTGKRDIVTGVEHKPHQEHRNYRQVRWLDHLREKIAVLLAPWAIYPDIREYHEKGKLP